MTSAPSLSSGSAAAANLGGPGALTIRVALADGYVRRAQIVSSRPHSLSRLFVGRLGVEAPVLAGSLFSLCGYSHRTAASLAIAAATNRTDDLDPGRYSVGLLAERLGEYLRSLITGWSNGAPDRATLGLVRDALVAARDLTGGKGQQTEAIALLAGSARTIGAGIGSGTGMMAAAVAEEAFLTRAPDALAPEDDERVIARLKSEEGFAALPNLPGRVVETGAFARAYPWAPMPKSAIAARLTARLNDLEEGAALLQAGGGANLAAFGGGDGQGWGAVESPRGRLYHWVQMGSDGTIANYGIVAPTEWNFHPNGPYIATILGAKVGDGDLAERKLSWLAVLFDPCVAFRVALEENAHA